MRHNSETETRHPSQCRCRPMSFSSRFYIILPFILVTISFYYILIESPSNLSHEYTTRYSSDQMRNFAVAQSDAIPRHRGAFYSNWSKTSGKSLDRPSTRFNINGKDVMVFLHVQKTAGTSFEKFLVRYLDIEKPCECTNGKKRCNCTRPNNHNEIWLFSRYSTGWLCGLHSDYTELFVSGCVDEALDKKEGYHQRRRYYYTTFLREPISRFISEFRHVNRGATWIGSRHICNGRPPTADELPICFDPLLGWEGVTIDEFNYCPFNLAFNRQTRMLADLTRINCYSELGIENEERDRIMLESAKETLRNMAFFGLKERMDDSQMLFENQFGLKFTRRLSNWTKSKSNDTQITQEQLERIRKRNKLDMELYAYAQQLFDSRLEQLRQLNAIRANEMSLRRANLTNS